MVVQLAKLGSLRSSVATFAMITIQGKPYAFVVDTGAAQTTVTSTVVSALGLPEDGSPISLKTIGCPVRAQPVTMRSWSIAGHTLPTTQVLSAPVSEGSVHSVDGVTYGGQLGSDVLSSFGRVSINFSSGRMTLGASDPSRGRAVPMRVYRRGHMVLPVVTATLDRKSARWIPDTGASLTQV
ncbi:MAG TPA: retropepsin-like aspartic protease, partial [Solirubrobacteraceae bacterium]